MCEGGSSQEQLEPPASQATKPMLQSTACTRSALRLSPCNHTVLLWFKGDPETYPGVMAC